MEKILKEKVRKGAYFLDQHQPGWADGIDLKNFDILNPYECVIGQTFGHFEVGMRKLNLDHDTILALGFDREDGPMDKTEVDLLDKFWTAAVEKRQPKEKK